MKKHYLPPIITNKNYLSPSVFTPANLLREARRQKSILNESFQRFAFWIQMVTSFRDIGRLSLDTKIHQKYGCSIDEATVNCFYSGIKKEIKNMLQTNLSYANVCKDDSAN